MAIVVRSWTGMEARALRGARRMSPTEFAAHIGVKPRVISRWAMLYTTQAYGKLADVQAVTTAVGYADEQFSHSDPAEDPSWMAYYDLAQHAGDTGHALFDIAIRGKFGGEARRRLRTAVAGHTPDAERSRTISMIKLASLTMSTGDPHEAADIGSVAVARASSLKSMRAAEDVHELRSYARRAGVNLARTAVM
jgi:hypothetical protein